ncbi:MAG: hypothetical protein V4637_13860, partial [Pseudomonadota bacterium]
LLHHGLRTEIVELLELQVQKLKLYGLNERLASVEAMDFAQLSDFRQAFVDPAAHQRVMDEFDRAARRAIAAGAEVIIRAARTRCFRRVGA